MHNMPPSLYVWAGNVLQHSLMLFCVKGLSLTGTPQRYYIDCMSAICAYYAVCMQAAHISGWAAYSLYGLGRSPQLLEPSALHYYQYPTVEAKCHVNGSLS